MMNRLQAHSLPAALDLKSAIETASAGKFHSATDDNHALFAPLHYEANYAYPLLVWLHGGGDSQRQLRRIMPMVSLRNYVAVAPRGTVMLEAEAEKHRGYQWLQSSQHVGEAEQKVLSAIRDATNRFNIRADRIYLAGFQSGGTMALRIAAENPGKFAGVLSLCGPFPSQGTPLARLNDVRQVPLFVAACREGTFYPTNQVCDDLRLFHAAGISITLREYPGEDGLSLMMLSDIDRWIMEQIVAPPVLEDVTPPRESGVG